MSVNMYHTHRHIYMYTYMYILYMQVFDRCHAVTKLVFAEVSVHLHVFAGEYCTFVYTRVNIYIL